MNDLLQRIIMIKTIATISAVSGVLVLQIVTKKYGYLQPTEVLRSITVKLGSAASFTGYYLAKISDLIGILKTCFYKVIDFIRPAWDAVSDACSELFGELFHLAWDPVKQFTDGYVSAIDEGVVNQLATILTSAIYVFGGTIGLAIALECIGLVRKNDKIRPSTYIRRIADDLYNRFSFISAMYIKMCNILGHISRMWNVVRVYLGPYAEQIEVAATSLLTACSYFIAQPIKGLWDGACNALTSIRVTEKMTIDPDEKQPSDVVSKTKTEQYRVFTVLTSVSVVAVSCLLAYRWFTAQ